MGLSKIQKLKKYFKSRSNVLMAFLFGSQGEKRGSKTSDWDIACYFKPEFSDIECETKNYYPGESEIWGDLVKILETDNVDFIVLNRAPATLASSAIKGIQLSMKDRKRYLEFMLRVTSEAEDYRKTAKEYAEIYWRSSSLSDEDRFLLNKRLVFLDTEFKDITFFKNITKQEYDTNRGRRRDVERWIENLMNSAIDIAKTVLASEKQPIPSSYREILRALSAMPDFPFDLCEQLEHWVELRNILAHEYLDIRWKRIEKFLQSCEPFFSNFITIVRERLK